MMTIILQRVNIPHIARVARPGCFLSWHQARRGYSSANLLNELVERGFVHNVTNYHALQSALSTPQVVYAGVDPTASSLHIGHLLPLMSLLHFRLHGHKIIPLIGGATGQLGDPSGRLTERKPAVTKQVEENVIGLTKSVELFFERASYYARTRVGFAQDFRPHLVVTSNLDWHRHFSMLDFLQHVGIHARVNTMLNKESVRVRLESQQGLSFTEFTYQLLQAYDFYHLYKHHGCTIQVGGSDQWGNILAGLEFIGRLDGHSTNLQELPAFGVTTPLLTTRSGEKFGKSAGNAIWLDSDLTGILDFYQYFLNVEDSDVEKLLKLFTLLPLSDIRNIVMVHNEKPEKRFGQRRLADEVTEMIHGNEGLSRARTLTKLLFESDYSNITTLEIMAAFGKDSRLVLTDEQELVESSVMKLATKYGLVSSGSASRALVQAQGLYANNITILDSQHRLKVSDLIDGRVAVLRAGKNKLVVLAIRQT